jgi:hypothetical protein
MMPVNTCVLRVGYIHRINVGRGVSRSTNKGLSTSTSGSGIAVCKSVSSSRSGRSSVSLSGTRDKKKFISNSHVYSSFIVKINTLKKRWI